MIQITNEQSTFWPVIVDFSLYFQLLHSNKASVVDSNVFDPSMTTKKSLQKFTWLLRFYSIAFQGLEWRVVLLNRIVFKSFECKWRICFWPVFELFEPTDSFKWIELPNAVAAAVTKPGLLHFRLRLLIRIRMQSGTAWTMQFSRCFLVRDHFMITYRDIKPCNVLCALFWMWNRIPGLFALLN